MRAKARRRTSGRRAFPALACSLLTLGAPSHGQDADCERLPPDARDRCLMVQACATIDDDQRRQECFQAAARPAAESKPAVASTPPADSAPSADGAPSADSAPSAVEKPGEEVTASEPRPSLMRRLLRLPRRGEPSKDSSDDRPSADGGVTQSVVESVEFDIPDRFAAQVTYVHPLARDRQLVVVDGQLVFEGGQAQVSRLKADDRVRISRTSSRFGNRFRFVGPTGRPFVANRIRCERLKLSAANRRKCAAVGRGAAGD